jgi:tubulin polyglutamylase TTLL4
MAKKNGVADTNISELKWPLSKFWDFVKDQGRDPKELWDRIKDVAVKSVISTASAMLKQQATFCPFSFLNREVFGMDILVDSDFKPWVKNF